MNPRKKFLLLVFAALVGLFILFWLFNTCAYNFWLAGQNIERREVYERRLYWMFALLAVTSVLEIFAIWRAVRMLKAISSELPLSRIEGMRSTREGQALPLAVWRADSGPSTPSRPPPTVGGQAARPDPPGRPKL
jgi:hypothetical protein